MNISINDKFKNLVSNVFLQILKEKGFKKRGNNFYRYKDDGIIHVISIQKSKWNSYEGIKFTFNIGIFHPPFWEITYNSNNDLSPPKFPTAHICAIQKRIGKLKEVEDLWYVITEESNLDEINIEITLDLNKFILPYLDPVSNFEDLATLLEKDHKRATQYFEYLIIYCESNQKEEAKSELKKILKFTSSKQLEERILKYAQKHNII